MRERERELYIYVMSINFQEQDSFLYQCTFNVLVVLPVGLDKRRNLYRVKYWDTTEILRICLVCVCWLVFLDLFIFPLRFLYFCNLYIRITELITK